MDKNSTEKSTHGAWVVPEDKEKIDDRENERGTKGGGGG